MRRILCACLVLACVFGVGAENVNGRVIAAKPEMVRTAVAARALIPTLKASPAKAAIIAEDEAIEWSEEATSLTAQGVRTLKGYRGGRMCAVVSEYGGKVAGWLDSDSHRKTFQVRTSADGLLTLTAEDAAARHVDDVSLDDEVPFSPDRRYAPVMRGAAANGKISAMTNHPLTRNDGVVRHYRAVFPVSNYIYRYNYYSDPEAVFANWASLEAFLN